MRMPSSSSRGGNRESDSGFGSSARGCSPRLVLSVGRFEWRRFAGLGLESDGGLLDLVSETLPARRHFFVEVDAFGARCERVPKGTLGTWSEIRAVARFVERERIESLVVISDRQHLRRCLAGLRLVLPERCALIPIASAPDEKEPPAGGPREMFKLFSYSALLCPLWLGLRFVPSRLRRWSFPGIKNRFTLSQPGFEKETFDRRKPLRVSTPQELRPTEELTIEARGVSRKCAAHGRQQWKSFLGLDWE